MHRVESRVKVTTFGSAGRRTTTRDGQWLQGCCVEALMAVLMLMLVLTLMLMPALLSIPLTAPWYCIHRCGTLNCISSY